MTDRLSLGVEIDTTKIKETIEALDRLTAAAERAAAAMGKLAGTPVLVERIGECEVMRIGREN